ncbi:hypothetical protein EVAR_47539_1 [Eumeta japonica]|uniref:Uncharacterized protein n=1 Tax=Eumeta variegata TaxID=151549 RepID=A0A4C1WRY6_EUMVA|nr:hypothetical protein EVAR_47539_1 [Eumeta japonica]
MTEAPETDRHLVQCHAYQIQGRTANLVWDIVTGVLTRNRDATGGVRFVTSIVCRTDLTILLEHKLSHTAQGKRDDARAGAGRVCASFVLGHNGVALCRYEATTLRLHVPLIATRRRLGIFIIQIFEFPVVVYEKSHEMVQALRLDKARAGRGAGRGGPT